MGHYWWLLTDNKYLLFFIEKITRYQLEGIKWAEKEKKITNLKISNNINPNFCLYEKTLEKENPLQGALHILLDLTEKRDLDKVALLFYFVLAPEGAGKQTQLFN